MDIVEFVERFYDTKLPEWQKIHIKTLYEMGTDAKIRICMPKNSGRHQALIHLNNAKELLFNGTQNDSK